MLSGFELLYLGIVLGLLLIFLELLNQELNPKDYEREDHVIQKILRLEF